MNLDEVKSSIRNDIYTDEELDEAIQLLINLANICIDLEERN